MSSKDSPIDDGSPDRSVGVSAGSGLRTRLRQKPTPLGTWVQMANPEGCELAAAAGFDFVVVDMEHGSFGWRTAADMIRAVKYGGGLPVVRIETGEPHVAASHIAKALDAGAAGLIVPMVTSGDQARQLATAARYPPLGERGACPRTVATIHGAVEWADYRAWADEEIALWALVEHPDAVANADEILDAVDGVVLGPVDYATVIQEAPSSDRVQAPLKSVAAAAREMGKDCVAVVVCGEEAVADHVAAWVEAGCSAVTVLSDRFALGLAYRRQLSAVRASQEG